VLVALTVGLGAKASFTNRGAKMGDLIRQKAKYVQHSNRFNEDLVQRPSL
jgi:hypothetical protein